MESYRFTSIATKEREAFYKLIDAKETLVVSLPDSTDDILRAKLADQQEIKGGADSRRHSSSLITAAAGGGGGTNKVVVDVRDFRSSLPSLLYSGGFTVIPRTLLVGDFIIASEICVERKGISDLLQSLVSGRLYHQAENMARYYKHPCLLIEFTLERPFTLQGVYEISPDSIQNRSVITQICQLCLAFPSLRLLWSRSPFVTVDIFKLIMRHHDEVDVNKAVLVGSDELFTKGNNNNTNSSLTHLNMNNKEFQQESIRLTAQEMLLSLPGININNYRMVMDQFENIAELSKAEVSQLTPLIGPINAMKLYTFFRQTSSSS